MDVLVSDTSVLIDLERGGLIQACFELPYQFSVPDVLYDRELKNHGGAELLVQGLTVVQSNNAISALATTYSRNTKALSAPDAFAIALAKSHGWVLLAGDGALRNVAENNDVECHGVLWVFDKLHEAAILTGQALHESLTTISEHNRCRLPRVEIQRRLTIYSGC